MLANLVLVGERWTLLIRAGLCPTCGVVPRPSDESMRPGPGIGDRVRPNAVSIALRST
ncbi:hypothetical protein QMK17_04325 [Rhodococcus sp. G-MC3]|uniref:hypothetical protein n=1 Tax=Rhodococcus sp. G-MC3 TaxID=3046209 RepID=UPI0024BBD0B7|nr:hypothetical protein [Rhodococcus sp. G-MC3]MDJ0392558.1 hypothetical protein [Rhodococcus sp. G-MC3]